MRACLWLVLSLASALVTVGAVRPAAASEAQFKAALAAAESANKEAGALKNRWTTTVQELDAAKKAASAGDFDQAAAHAAQAEALARASIAQAKEQETAWRAAVIR